MAPAELSTLPRIHQRIWAEICHGMQKKNHGGVRRKTFVSKQKAQLHAHVDSLSSCEGRKADKVQVCLEEKPENKQRDRNQLKVKQQQTQSAFSKLSHTCLTIVRTKERSGSPLCVLSMSFKTFQLLLLSFSSVWWWLFYDLTLIPLFEFCTLQRSLALTHLAREICLGTQKTYLLSKHKDLLECGQGRVLVVLLRLAGLGLCLCFHRNYPFSKTKGMVLGVCGHPHFQVTPFKISLTKGKCTQYWNLRSNKCYL